VTGKRGWLGLGRRRLWVAVLSVLALLLVACFMAGLFPQEPVRRLAERRLRAVFGPRARIGALHVLPATLEIEVRDLALDTPSLRLELPRARVDLSSGSLLAQLIPGRAGPVAIRVLEIDSPRIELHPSKTGESYGQSAPSIVIEELDVGDGTLTYSADPDHRATLHGVEVKGSLGQGTLVATVREGTWSGRPLVAVGPARAEMSVSPELAIDLVSFTGRVGRSEFQARGPIGRPGSWAPKLDLAARLDLSDLASFGAPSIDGSLDVAGRLVGPLGSAALDLDAHGTVFSGRVEGKAHLSGGATDGRFHFTDVDLDRIAGALGAADRGWRGRASGDARWSGDVARSVRVTTQAEASLLAAGYPTHASLSVSGPIDLSRGRVDLEWVLQADVSPPAVAGAPPPVAAPGLIEARLRASGSARGPMPPVVIGQVDGDLSVSTAKGPTVATVRGSVTSDAGRTSTELKVLALGGSLRLGAEARGSVFRRLTAQGESLSLAPLGAGGTARLTLAATGPWNRLSGSAHLDVAGATWEGVPLGDVSVVASSEAGNVKATFSVPGLQARGKALLPARASPTLSASLELDGSHLDALSPLWPAGPAVSGSLTGRVDVTLPLGRPAATEAVAHVDAIRLESGAWSAESSGPFVVRARDGGVAVEGLALTGPGLDLELAGSVGTGREGSLDLTADARLDLEHAPPVAGLTWQGALEARVALSGRTDRPRASGFVTARDLTVAGEDLPVLEIPDGRVDLDSDALDLRRLTARLAGGEVTVEGRVPYAAVARAVRRDEKRVSPDESAAVTLSFEGVNIAPLVEKLRADHASPVAGQLSGRLELAGGLTSPDEVRAALRVTPTGLALGDLPLEVSPLSLRLESGEAVLESATVTGQGSQLTVGGRFDLEKKTLDASAHGALRLRALSPFLSDAAVSGRGELDLAVSGALAAPTTQGRIAVHEGTLRLRTLPQSVTGVEARLVLDGREVRVESASAALGGGALSLSGKATLSADFVPDVDLQLSGKGVALRYPEGLRSRLDADLGLKGKPGKLALTGDVRAQRGRYDLDVALEQSLLGATAVPEPSPLLRSIALDLRVETVHPVLIRNNLAQLDATGSLNVLGDLESPAPVGRLDLRAGGQVFLQQREFTIESGRLTYDGTWDPDISLRAKAVLRGVDLGDVYGRQDVEVQVSVAGPLAQPRMTFTSDPGGYSESEIVTMIVTNRARSQALSSGAWVAGEQTALLLTGRLTRGLTSELQGLGLDEVTIQPELLARETDPGARFTFGKHLTDQLRLIYSLSLNDPENRFVELDLDPGRDLNLLAQRRDDGSFTLGGGQRLRFFGPRRRPLYREPKVRLQEVAVELRGAVSEKAVRDMLRTRAGKKVSEWDLQDDAERVRESLKAQGYMEAEVTAHSDEGKATFRVDAGPRFDWRVEGMADPPSLDEIVQSSLFEEEALERGRARLLETLHGRGLLEATVDTSVTGDGQRTIVFAVTPGPRQRVRAVLFPGASHVPTNRLLEAAGGASRLLSNPDDARRAIRAAYRDRYYLTAQVQPPVVSRVSDELTITVPIEEGSPARVTSVRFAGASRAETSLARAAGVAVGQIFDPALIPEAVVHLRDLYYRQGYPNVQITPRIEPAASDVDLVFEISEGQRLTVGEIEIVGLRSTRAAFVRKTLGLHTGDPLDPRRLAAAERKLLSLGTFSRVSITHSGEDPAGLRVEVEEEARLVAGYQARYNDDRGLSGDLDGEVRNLLGRGLALGARYSYAGDDQQIRASVQLPSLGPFGDLTGSLFRDSKQLPVVQDGPTLLQLQKGLELQLTRPLPDRWNLLYGYRFKTSRVTSDLDEFSTTTRIASLDVSLLRDTRDNPLNARRGRFWSVNLEIAPRALASDLDFVKGMAQLFATRSFGRSLSWAQGYRLGLAHVFSGERLVFSERFQAGGGNSVRGFATDSLGPRDVFGDPAGGEAVVVFNQELRYMHPSGVGVVVFWDAGNVFAKASDLSLDLRHALGAGLRWDSPVGLLRADIGFPLSREADEKPYRLFFSLGQAF
jgi:outer membrane protein assembly complex protein YaeT